MQQPELDGIHIEVSCQLVHQAFPGPLRFLLTATPRTTQPDCVRLIVEPDGFPVWNTKRVQLRRVGGIPPAPYDFDITGTEPDFMNERRNVAVLLESYLEFRNVLGLDVKVRQLLVFREHQLYGSSRHFGDTSNIGIERFCSGAQRSSAKSAAIVLVDETDVRRIDVERPR